MSDILNYKFYLNFKNIDSFGRIEITEPIGFDGASFLVEQEDKRYGRDAYKINEEISLNFYKGSFDVSTMRQLPNGTVIYNLTQGYDYLIDCFNRYGFESDVDFEIELNSVLFIPSNLDFQTSETDGYSYMTCKAVQVQDKQLIKRRSDLIVDVFSDKDIDGNPITPLVAQNILLRAKPSIQISKWKSILVEPRQFIITISGGIINFASNIIEYGIDDSLSYLSSLENSIFDFKYIRAAESLTDVKIKISNFFCEITDVQNGSGTLSLRVVVGNASDVVTETYILDTIGNGQSFDEDYELTIPLIDRDSVLCIGIFKFGDGVIGNAGSMEIDIQATSTALDTVIKGVRWIDLIKQNVKSINGFDVVAPQLQSGGEHYNNFGFTGNLIKRRDDVPFPVKFDDLVKTLMEHNGDYQVIDGSVYINNYESFYANNEIGAFLSSPDESFKKTFNPRFAINQYEVGFEEFEQDKDESNTTDSVHTETQWSLDNVQVENKKEIKLPQIRDPFKISFSQRESTKTTTSTSDDDSLFLIDVVNLSPSSRGEFTASMTHNVSVNDDGDTVLKLLKRPELASWAVLGFNVGDNFNISSTQNIGSYNVLEIEDTIITLITTLFVPTFQGVFATTVNYPYSNVEYVNRTNEGFSVIENLLSPEKFGNLLYTPKRIINKWKNYLATASIFNKIGSLRNRYFRNNGNLTTRFQGETINTIEKEDISNTDLGEGVLTPFLYGTKLLVPYNNMVSIMNAIDTVNDDNSIAGFIRCIDPNNRVIKLYPKKLEYIPSTEVLTLLGEERNEGEGVNIIITSSVITINVVGYDVENLSSPFYENDGDYFKIYDKDKLPIINPTKYTDITVNGLTFGSSSDLLNYLLNT
mgnify:CR=1 FL=1